MLKNKKFIFIFILCMFFMFIFLNTKVFAVNKEDVLVTIESEPSVVTEVEKGDIITYKIIIENKSTNQVFKYPIVFVQVPGGVEFIDITTDEIIMKDINDFSALVTCISEKEVMPNSTQTFEIKCKVKGTTRVVKFPMIMYMVFDEKVSSYEEASTIVERILNSDCDTIEDFQIALGSDASIEILESQGEHTVLSNTNIELWAGVSASLTSNPSAGTNVNVNDTITYKFTLKNVSEYEYIYPYVMLFIPEGTEFMNVYSDNEILVNTFEPGELYGFCMFGELSENSEICLELKVKVTGESKEITFPYILYTIFNSEYTLNDVLEVMSSTDFLFAGDIQGIQAVLGDVGYVNEIISNDAHYINSEPIVEGISSNRYTIEENIIKGVDINTTVTEFTNNITNNTSYKIRIFKDDKEIFGDEKLSTGVILKLNDTLSYTIIVRGDINGDAKISATDLSLQKSHLVKNIELDGNRNKAADINDDGKITVTDLSRLKMILVGM